MSRWGRVLAGLWCLLALAGCEDDVGLNTRPSLAEVAGTYVYQLRTGEIEALTLREDLTFTHALFADRDLFAQDGAAEFREEGTWKEHWAAGQYSPAYFYHIQLAMLSIYSSDFPEARTRNPVPVKASYGSSGGLEWDGGKGYATILRNEEQGYWMHRIQRPEEIEAKQWRYHREYQERPAKGEEAKYERKPGERPSRAEVAGTYVYMLRTGEIEALTLREDLTFTHALFANRALFAQNGAATFREEGTWEEHWRESRVFSSTYYLGVTMLEIYADDFPEARKRHPTPSKTQLGGEVGLRWRGGKSDAIIFRNEKRGYWMHRIQRPEEIDAMEWDYHSD